MANIEHSEAPSSAQQLQEAGKMMVGAAGSVAVDRVRVEVDARSSRAAVELKALANAMRASASNLHEQGHGDEAEIVEKVASRADRLAARLPATDSLRSTARAGTGRPRARTRWAEATAGRRPEAMAALRAEATAGRRLAATAALRAEATAGRRPEAMAALRAAATAALRA